MPFASKAQQGYLNAHPDKLGAARLAEFNAASKGLKLPKRAAKKKKAKAKPSSNFYGE